MTINYEETSAAVIDCLEKAGYEAGTVHIHFLYVQLRHSDKEKISMTINYEETSAAVIDCLEKAGYKAGAVHIHQLCYDEIGKYLSKTATSYSPDAAINWLESRRADWKHQTYMRYRLAAYRFAQYVECGNIGRTYGHNGFYKYHDTDESYTRLSDDYKILFNGFYDKISSELTTARQYSNGAKDFLLFMMEKNCNTPSELAIDHLFEYVYRLRESEQRLNTRSKHMSGVNSLLSYFYEQEYIPRCYLTVVSLNSKTINRHESLILSCKYQGRAFHPSKELEEISDEFMKKLKKRRYDKSSEDRFRYAMNDFFIFLELNRIEYSPETLKLWENNTKNAPSWESRFQTVTLFDEYMRTGHIGKRKKVAWKPLQVESLPDWSHRITNDFLSLRQREGWEEKTITMSRASCVRFFSFLNKKGIVSPNGITHALVKEFHDTDPHLTPQSRNMYSAGVRKLLEYMAERGFVPANLYLAVSNQCATRREIVSILSPELTSALYDYRKNAKSPLELRNAAIIMVGLRMGLRASDIVNLKIDDIDWDKRKLSIIQTKTKKAVTLYVPTDAGNSIYKYIKQGRPKSGTLGTGYIFISHRAPYAELSYAICGKTIDDVLALYGLKLQKGQGFHITRKTFATQLLSARVSIDTVADSLGHATLDTVDSYLAHDEAGMRLCPLSFTIGGAL